MKLRQYYLLTKPGIVRGNLLFAVAGYFFAAQSHPMIGTFLGMLTGLGLIIASGCVFNNYIDRDIDTVMARTNKRPLVTGAISIRAALIFGTMLGLTGGVILAIFTNELTTVVALFGLWAYVALYGFAKRQSVHGTLIGSISGSIPPVVGYVAVTGKLDLAAGLLFLLIVCWQMPHFYGIALMKAKDYSAAKIPVLPLVSGTQATKLQSYAYIIGFIIVSLLFTILGYSGYIFAIFMAALGIYWIRLGKIRYAHATPEQWGRHMFVFSLLVVSITSVMLPLGRLLP